ncbi:hypothetical protein [Microbacterium sp. GXF6406]
MATHKPLTPHQAVGPVAYYARIGDAEGEREARRNLAEAKITAVINKALAASPKLSNQQIHRITSLLRSGGAL